MAPIQTHTAKGMISSMDLRISCGAHRFLYGQTHTGTIWFFTLGLFFIGWIVRSFLNPVDGRRLTGGFASGPRANFNLSWVVI